MDYTYIDTYTDRGFISCSSQLILTLSPLSYMDRGLLTEGSSNGGGGTRTTSSSVNNNNNQPKYGRRSNVIAYGSSYQKAAALVDLVLFSSISPFSFVFINNIHSLVYILLCFVFSFFILYLSFYFYSCHSANILLQFYLIVSILASNSVSPTTST